MSTDGGSWAPFGSYGDDDERPAEPPPPSVDEPPSEPAPAPVEEPAVEQPPVEEPPAVAFAPPVASEPPPDARLNWPPPAPPAPAAPPPPISQWPGAAPQPYGAPRATASNAVASLVLGIVGLVLCPVVASIPAVVLGTSAKREIRANPQLGGAGQATWGVVLGWIGIAWGVFVLIAVLSVSGGST